MIRQPTADVRLEARAWLQTPGHWHALERSVLGGREEVWQFVDDLYSLGAPRVEVAGLWDEARPYADTFFVTLPADYVAAIAVLVRAAQAHPELVQARDGAVELWWD